MYKSMLRVLCFCACVSHALLYSDNSGNKGNLGSAPKSAFSAKAEIAELRRKLSEYRSRYTDLYIKHSALEQELELLKTKTAHMLLDLPDEKKAYMKAAEEAVQRLEAQNSAIEKMRKKTVEFKNSLNTILNVLEPSEVIRKKLDTQLDILITDLSEFQQAPSLVAWRGGESLERMECRILAVNDELQILIAGKGERDGIRPGAIITAFESSQQIAELRVVEVRTFVCAALLVKGNLEKVTPGSVARIGDVPAHKQ